MVEQICFHSEYSSCSLHQPLHWSSECSLIFRYLFLLSFWNFPSTFTRMWLVFFWGWWTWWHPSLVMDSILNGCQIWLLFTAFSIHWCRKTPSSLRSIIKLRDHCSKYLRLWLKLLWIHVVHDFISVSFSRKPSPWLLSPLEELFDIVSSLLLLPVK